MATDAAEDYLRRMYLAIERSGSDQLSMGDLANGVGVSPGSATAMVKKLARDGLVDYEPYAGVRLRPQGSRLALALIRRHRLIESFLVERLGMDWSEIHEEAERLEHAISDRVLERLDAFLGHPSVDPHGDPIPNAAGEVRASSTRTLAECARGDLVRVVRVLDQAGEFLKFVARKGLRPGVRIAVEDVDEAGDAIRVTMRGEGEVTLGVRAAAKLAVEEASI